MINSADLQLISNYVQNLKKRETAHLCHAA